MLLKLGLFFTIIFTYLKQCVCVEDHVLVQTENFFYLTPGSSFNISIATIQNYNNGYQIDYNLSDSKIASWANLAISRNKTAVFILGSVPDYCFETFTLWLILNNTKTDEIREELSFQFYCKKSHNHFLFLTLKILAAVILTITLAWGIIKIIKKINTKRDEEFYIQNDEKPVTQEETDPKTKIDQEIYSHNNNLLKSKKRYKKMNEKAQTQISTESQSNEESSLIFDKQQPSNISLKHDMDDSEKVNHLEFGDLSHIHNITTMKHDLSISYTIMNDLKDNDKVKHPAHAILEEDDQHSIHYQFFSFN